MFVFFSHGWLHEMMQRVVRYRMSRKTIIVFCLGTMLIIIGTFIVLLFLVLSSDDDLEFSGRVSSDVYKRKYETHLPEEALFIDYFQDGSRALFARIKVSEIRDERKLMEDFQKICRRNISYKKHRSISGFVPSCDTEIWWDPSIIEKCDYYTTEMPYRDPMFWLDRKNKYIYMFWGN